MNENLYSVQFSDEAEKDLNFKIKCKDCQSVVGITKQQITFNVSHKTKDGQTIFLTYFDCPVCKVRHYVQVDNRQTSELRKSVSMLAARFIAVNRRGKKIPENQKSKFNKQTNKLKVLRCELMKKWEGETVTNTITGEKVELHLPFVKA